MSGSEEQASEQHGLISALRSLIIAGMMACVVMSLVGLVQRIVPYWPGGYLALLAFVVCLEGIVTERLVKEHSLGVGAKTEFRVAEWVIIMIIVRLVLSLLGGWSSLAYDASRWLANPTAIFDAAYITTGIVLLLVWQTSISLVNDLLLLETSPADDPAPPITSAEYWIWIGRPKNRVDTQAAMGRLSRTFSWGGVLLLLFAGLARLDIELVTRLAHPSTPGIVLNALVYFLLGLAFLGQARYATLRSQWRGEGIDIAPQVGRRWAVLGITFVSAVAVAVTVLPTGYSADLLQALYVGATGIINPVIHFLMWILSAILFVVTLILQLFSGDDVVPQPPAAPSPRPPPPETLPPAVEGLAWLELLRTLLFWGVLAWIVGYSFYRYFQQRSDLWATLKQIRLLRWLVDLWRTLLRGSRHAAKRAREGLSAALKWVRPRLAAPDRPWRFVSLRSLTKRQLVRYFYLSTLRRAAEVGWRRKPSQTPYEYQGTLEEKALESEEDVAVLTQAFVEARYDVRDFSAEEASVVKRVWQRMKALLRQARRDRDKTGSLDQTDTD